MPGFMDPLGELPSSAENSDSDFDEADIPENLRATLHVKQKPAAEVKPVTFEDLQKVGYTSAASLTMCRQPSSTRRHLRTSELALEARKAAETAKA